MVVLLYNIRSLYNVGSIFRTSDAAGVDKIYLCGITPAPVDHLGYKRQQLVKVSLGAEEFVQWEKSSNMLAIMEKLKKNGYKILAIEQSKKSLPYYKIRQKKTNYSKTALFLGGEIRGLPPSILNKCDGILEIPMFGKKESLNVSVAFGIVIFHLVATVFKRYDKMNKLKKIKQRYDR